MQVGNPKALDAEREALRDRFDSVWTSCETIGPVEMRAIRCAIALDAPRYEHNRGNWTILPGGRMTGQHNDVIWA